MEEIPKNSDKMKANKRTDTSTERKIGKFLQKLSSTPKAEQTSEASSTGEGSSQSKFMDLFRSQREIGRKDLKRKAEAQFTNAFTSLKYAYDKLYPVIKQYYSDQGKFVNSKKDISTEDLLKMFQENNRSLKQTDMLAKDPLLPKEDLSTFVQDKMKKIEEAIKWMKDANTIRPLSPSSDGKMKLMVDFQEQYVKHFETALGDSRNKAMEDIKNNLKDLSKNIGELVAER